MQVSLLLPLYIFIVASVPLFLSLSISQSSCLLYPMSQKLFYPHDLSTVLQMNEQVPPKRRCISIKLHGVTSHPKHLSSMMEELYALYWKKQEDQPDKAEVFADNTMRV